MTSILDPDPELTIADLQVGEYAYTMTWAIHTDEAETRAWINTRFPISGIRDGSSGTMRMKVSRTEEGLVVAQWSIERRYINPHGQYLMGDREWYQPVLIK